MLLQIGLLERTWFLQTGLPKQILLGLTDFVGWTLIVLTELFKQTLFLQTGLPEQILLALTDFVEWALITLPELLERVLLTLIVLLGQTSPILTGSVEQHYYHIWVYLHDSHKK